MAAVCTNPRNRSPMMQPEEKCAAAQSQSIYPGRGVCQLHTSSCMSKLGLPTLVKQELILIPTVQAIHLRWSFNEFTDSTQEACGSVFHTESWCFIQEKIQPVKNLILSQPFPQVRATCDSNITMQESWQMEEGHLPKGQLPSLRPPLKSAQREFCLLKNHLKNNKPMI